MVRTARIDATIVKTTLHVVYNTETVMTVDVLTPANNLHDAKVWKRIEMETKINFSSFLFTSCYFRPRRQESNSIMSEFKYLKYLSIFSHFDAQTENNSYKAILMINNRNSNII